MSKPVRVREYHQRREFRYDDAGNIIEVEQPAEPVTIAPSVERIPRGFVYDPVRGEYYNPDTGEVIESRGEEELLASPKPRRFREMKPHSRQLQTYKHVQNFAMNYLTHAGFAVGMPENAYLTEEGNFEAGPGGTAEIQSGYAPDRDIIEEVSVLQQQLGGSGGIPGISTRGVAGALAIVAVERRRNRRLTPTDLVPEPEGFYAEEELPDDPEERAAILKGQAELEKERDDIRIALRAVRERLRA